MGNRSDLVILGILCTSYECLVDIVDYFDCTYQINYFYLFTVLRDAVICFAASDWTMKYFDGCLIGHFNINYILIGSHHHFTPVFLLNLNELWDIGNIVV